MEVNTLPNITAPIDNPIFANMFNPKIENCLLSKRLLDSSANEDIVVNEPQNPIATRSEYFGSRFQITETIEKIPRTKLPSTLIARTFNGKAPNQKGVDTILYLRNVPAKAPTANNTNSIPFIFLPTKFFLTLVGIISIQDRSGLGFHPKANAIAYFGRIALEYLKMTIWLSNLLGIKLNKGLKEIYVYIKQIQLRH